jgi:hypothetical protein
MASDLMNNTSRTQRMEQRMQPAPVWEEGMIPIQSFAIGSILGWAFWVATCFVAVMVGAGDWMASNSDLYLKCSLVAGALLGLAVGVSLFLRAAAGKTRSRAGRVVVMKAR